MVGVLGRVRSRMLVGDETMTEDDRLPPDVDALLGATERHRQWVRDAHRFHSKHLFRLWLLLVLALCRQFFVMLTREDLLLLLSISSLLLLLILVTGAYVFQEVAKVHRRIDAILRLLEEAERKIEIIKEDR